MRMPWIAPEINSRWISERALSDRPNPFALRLSKGGSRCQHGYLMCIPEIAREMTRRWISEMPSKSPTPFALSLSKGRVPVLGAPTQAGGFETRPYLMCIPEIAREMTSRWISEVPSKIV